MKEIAYQKITEYDKLKLQLVFSTVKTQESRQIIVKRWQGMEGMKTRAMKRKGIEKKSTKKAKREIYYGINFIKTIPLQK